MGLRLCPSMYSCQRQHAMSPHYPCVTRDHEPGPGQQVHMSYFEVTSVHRLNMKSNIDGLGNCLIHRNLRQPTLPCYRMALLSHYLGNGPVFNHPGTDTLDIQDLRQPVHTIQRAHEFKRMGDYTNTPELTCSQKSFTATQRECLISRTIC